MKLYSHLASLPAFACLDDTSWADLETVMTIRDYSDGECFFREGDPGDGLYLILDGTVSVTASDRDRPSRLHAGDFFGLVALLDEGPRSATCTADGLVLAAFLPRSAFVEIYRSNSALAFALQMLVARQLVHDTRAYSQALIDAARRQEAGGLQIFAGLS